MKNVTLKFETCLTLFIEKWVGDHMLLNIFLKLMKTRLSSIESQPKKVFIDGLVFWSVIAEVSLLLFFVLLLLLLMTMFLLLLLFYPRTLPSKFGQSWDSIE